DTGTGLITKQYVFSTHLSTPESLGLWGSSGSLEVFFGLDDGQNIVLAHDENLFTVNLHSLARIFAEQDALSYFDRQRGDGTVFITFTIAHSNNFALFGFFCGGIGDHDARGSRAFCFDSLDDNPVVKGTNL